LRFKGDAFEVDRSHGIPEIEFTHPKKASLHFNRYKEFVEGVVEGRIDFMQMQKDIEDLKRAVATIMTDKEGIPITKTNGR
jgi:hypothetical protein